MTLQLNQRAIPGHDIKISIKLPFGDSDLSGQSSNTSSAETGMKAKELAVSLVIPFTNQKWLTEINDLAESTNKETGARTIYRVGHDAANAVKFYEGKFAQELTIKELNDIQGWQVSFIIREHLSVPERKSQREPIKPAKQQGGDVVLAGNDVESQEIPPNTEMSTFETFLSYANDAFGSVFSSDDDKEKTV